MSEVPDFGGEFEVVRPIGRGSMATVYLARDVALRRLVLFGRVPTGSVRTEGEQAAAAVEYVEEVVPEPEPEGPSSETLGRLLDRRRR